MKYFGNAQRKKTAIPYLLITFQRANLFAVKGIRDLLFRTEKLSRNADGALKADCRNGRMPQRFGFIVAPGWTKSAQILQRVNRDTILQREWNRHLSW